MDLTGSNFEDYRFDLIICSDVLVYIEKDDVAFSELARVLKRGGVLLLTVPHDTAENKDYYKDYNMVRPEYTKREANALCMKNGLTILKSLDYFKKIITI